jgi:integrase
MREPGVKIQDLWYSTKDGKADLSRPTARKGRGKRYRVTTIDLQGQPSTEHHATKKAAEERQKELSAKLVTGAYASRSAGRALFSEVAEQWYDAKAVKVKGATLENYRSLLDTHVLPKWGTTAVGDIDWQTTQKWIGELSKAKPSNKKQGELSASRVVQAYHVLRGVLGYAVRSRLLSINPASDIDLPRKAKADKMYLTHQQLADLAGGCGDWDALVLVMGYCGLRWGEVTALNVGDVDFGRGRIEVTKAVEHVGRKYLLGTTKTHETRSVPVSKPVLEVLRERIGERRADWVLFPGKDGYLKTYEFRRAAFDPAAISVGVGGLVPHELRHTCASLAIQGRATIKTVQRLLGHATATMTLDEYGHLYPDDLDDVALQLGLKCVYPVRTEGDK